MPLLQQKFPPVPPELSALINQAQTANKAGKTDEALALYQQVVAQAQAAKSGRAEVIAYYNSAQIHRRLGRLPQALELYQKAIPLYQSLGDLRFAATSLNHCGGILMNLGRIPEGEAAFVQALELNRALGDTKGEAIVLENLGVTATIKGEGEKALAYLEQALTAHKALNDSARIASTLVALGNAYSAQSQPGKALSAFQQALTLFQAQGNQARQGAILNNIGLIYDTLGQPERALADFQKALTIARAVGDRAFEANVLLNLGSAYKNLGQRQKALAHDEQALALYRTQNNPRGEAQALHNLGTLYTLTAPQKAIPTLEKGLSLFRTIQDRPSEGRALLALGTAALAQHQYPTAKSYYQQALPLHQALGEKTGEINASLGLAQAAEGQKQLAVAEGHYAHAVTQLELLRARLDGLAAVQSSLLALTHSAYAAYLSVLQRQGKVESAFAVAQKTKARSLLDLMVSGRVDLSAELTPEERQQEQTLRQRAEQLNQRMVQEGVQNEVGAKQRFAALQAELKTAESELQRLTDSLLAKYPRLAQRRAAKTATVPDIAKLLPDNTALLEYLAVDDESLALFVVRRGKVHALSLPVAAPNLARKTAAFRAACANPKKEYQTAARELYKLLVAPAEKHLSGATHLIVCPDGPLWDVPFQALLADGQFLLQRFALSYAYSATGVQAAVAAKQRLRKPQGTMLALANPDFGTARRFGDTDTVPGQRPIDSPSRPIDSPSRPLDSPSRAIDSTSRAIDSVSRAGRITPLPGTQREANVLERLFPSIVLTGQKAQESHFKRLAGQFRYLHVATHGIFNDTAPLLSSLVLAAPSLSGAGGEGGDGFLTARELFGLDLCAELTVLSACNTARGTVRTGDGMIGLTWALFVAGCPTQVVSQWAVDDASTALLMERFYKSLQNGKAAALRQASLSLQKESKYRHPYYWAPFILIGDGR